MSDIAAVTQQVERALGDLDRELNPAVRQSELDAALVDFAPGRQWAYATEAQREEVADRLTAEQDRRSGEAMFWLQKRLVESEPIVEQQIAQLMEPPDPETVWTQRAGRAGLTAAELIGLQTVDELRLARFEREFASLQPSAVLARYLRALGDPLLQEHATLIRFVERRHGAHWDGLDVTTDSEREAATVLHTTIRGTREGRLTPEATAARDVIVRGNRAHDYARNVHRVRQLRPVGV